MLAYARNGRVAFLWDVATGKEIQLFDSGDNWGWTSFCAFTPGGELVLSDNTKLRFFNAATGQETRAISAGRTIALSPDSRVFVRMTNYNQIRDGEKANLVFGDATTGKTLFPLDGVIEWGSGRCGLAFAPGGKTIALLAISANAIHLRDITSGKLLQTLRPSGPQPSVLAGADVSFTTDGQVVLARLNSGDLARWDLESGKELPRLQAGNGPPVGGLRVLTRGKRLLAPTVSGWVRVWDTATGKELPIPGRYQSRAVLALA